MIGTDRAEFWLGDETRAIWAQQMRETGAFPVTATEIHAWEEGTIGWAGVKETIDWEGQTLESRATYVLHLEHGDWKVVHVHWSFPRANQETLGRSLTVSLDELEQTLQRAKPDLSASLAVDGTVTIVFTDIVDSTVMLSRLGDRTWVDVIRRHNAVIEEVTMAHAAPSSRRRATDRCSPSRAPAGRSLAHRRSNGRSLDPFADLSPLNPGEDRIHTGDAMKEAEHFYGTTVHYAARVASHALGGEVLVSSTVHGLVGSTPGVVFVEGREVDLKRICRPSPTLRARPRVNRPRGADIFGGYDLPRPTTRVGGNGPSCEQQRAR